MKQLFSGWTPLLIALIVAALVATWYYSDVLWHDLKLAAADTNPAGIC